MRNKGMDKMNLVKSFGERTAEEALSISVPHPHQISKLWVGIQIEMSALLK